MTRRLRALWRGTLIKRLQARLPMVNLRDENDVLREEIAERDELIRRQAARIERLEFNLRDMRAPWR